MPSVIIRASALFYLKMKYFLGISILVLRTISFRRNSMNSQNIFAGRRIVRNRANEEMIGAAPEAQVTKAGIALTTAMVVTVGTAAYEATQWTLGLLKSGVNGITGYVSGKPADPAAPASNAAAATVAS